MRFDWRTALAVALPLAGLMLGVVRGEQHRARATHFSFDVAGYDPRDLLHGHYLAYSIDYHEQLVSNSCADGDPECCLCLEVEHEDGPASEAPAHVVQTTRMDCESAGACGGRLATPYRDQLTRFYIAEARADELTTKITEAARKQQARVVVAIDGAGVPQVEALVLAGELVSPQR